MNDANDFQFTLEQGWHDLQAFAAGDTNAPLRLHAVLHASSSRLYQLHCDEASTLHPNGGVAPSNAALSSGSWRLLAIQALAPQLLLRVCNLQWPTGGLVRSHAALAVSAENGGSRHPISPSGNTDRPSTTPNPNAAPAVPSAAIILVAMLNAAYVSQVLASMMSLPPRSRPLQLEELLCLYIDTLSRTTSLSLLSPSHFTQDSSGQLPCGTVTLPEIAERQLVLCVSLLLLLLRTPNQLVPSIQDTFPSSRVGEVAHVLLTLQLWGMAMDVLGDAKRLDIGGVRRTQLRRGLHQRVDLLLEFTEEALRYFLAIPSRNAKPSGWPGTAGQDLFTSHVFLRSPPIHVLLHAMRFMNHGVVFPLEGYRLKNNCISSMSEVGLAAAPPQHPLQQFLQGLSHRWVWQWATHVVGSSIAVQDQDNRNGVRHGSGRPRPGAISEVSSALSFICAAVRLCTSVEESTVELLHSSLLLSIHLQSSYQNQLSTSQSSPHCTFLPISIRGILYSSSIVSAIMESAGKSILLLDYTEPHHTTGESHNHPTRWMGGGVTKEGSTAGPHTSSPSSSVLPSLFPLLSEASQTLLFVLQRGGGGMGREAVGQSGEEGGGPLYPMAIEEGEEDAEAVRAACEAINCLAEELCPDPIPAFEPTDDVEDYEEMVTLMREANADKQMITNKLHSFFVACQEAIAHRLERCVMDSFTLPLGPQQRSENRNDGRWNTQTSTPATLKVSGNLFFGDGPATDELETLWRSKKEKTEEVMEALDIIATTILSDEDLHQVGFQNYIVALWVTYERLYELLQELPVYLSSSSCAEAGLLSRLPSCHALLHYCTSSLPRWIQREVEVEQHTQNERAHLRYQGTAFPPLGWDGSTSTSANGFPTSLGTAGSSLSWMGRHPGGGEDPWRWRSLVLAEAMLLPAVIHRLIQKGTRTTETSQEGMGVVHSAASLFPTFPTTMTASQPSDVVDRGIGKGLSVILTAIEEEGLLQSMALLLKVLLSSIQQSGWGLKNYASFAGSNWKEGGGAEGIPQVDPLLIYWRFAAAIARGWCLLCRTHMQELQHREHGKGLIALAPSPMSWKEAMMGLISWMEAPFPFFVVGPTMDDPFSIGTFRTTDTMPPPIYGFLLDMSYALGSIGEMLGEEQRAAMLPASSTVAGTADPTPSAVFSSAAVKLEMQLFFRFPRLDDETSVMTLLSRVSDGVLEAAEWERAACATFSIASPLLLLDCAAAFEENTREEENHEMHRPGGPSCASPSVDLRTQGGWGSAFSGLSFPSHQLHAWIHDCVAPRLRETLFRYFSAVPQGMLVLSNLFKQWWCYHLCPSECSFPGHHSPAPHGHGGSRHSNEDPLSSLAPTSMREQGAMCRTQPGSAAVHWRLVSTLFSPLSALLSPFLRIPLLVEVLGAFTTSLQRGMESTRGTRQDNAYAATAGMDGGTRWGASEEETAREMEDEMELLKEMALTLPRWLGLDTIHTIRSCLRAQEGCLDGLPLDMPSTSPYVFAALLLPLLQSVASLCQSFTLFCFTSRCGAAAPVLSSSLPYQSAPVGLSGSEAAKEPPSETGNRVVGGEDKGGQARPRTCSISLSPSHFVVFSSLLHVTAFLFEALPRHGTPRCSSSGMGHPNGRAGEGIGSEAPGMHGHLTDVMGETRRPPSSSPKEVELQQVQYWRGEGERMAIEVYGQGGQSNMGGASATSLSPSHAGLLLQWLESFFSIFFSGVECWMLTKGGNTMVTLCNENGDGDAGSPIWRGMSGGSPGVDDDSEDEEEWGGGSSPFSPASPSFHQRASSPFSLAKDEACDTVVNYFRKDLAIIGSLMKILFGSQGALPAAPGVNCVSGLPPHSLEPLRHALQESIIGPGYTHLDAMAPGVRSKMDPLLNGLIHAVDFYERQGILSRAV